MTKASAIPPATADRPVALAGFNALKRVQDADHRAEQSDERRRRADGGEGREAALHFGVNDGDGAFETALGGFDYFSIRNLLRSRLKFGKAGGDDLGDVALLVALGDGDCFVELAFFQCAGDLLNEHTRLLAGRAVHQGAVNHDAEGIDGKNEKVITTALRQKAHRVPTWTSNPRLMPDWTEGTSRRKHTK